MKVQSGVEIQDRNNYSYYNRELYVMKPFGCKFVEASETFQVLPVYHQIAYLGQVLHPMSEKKII